MRKLTSTLMTVLAVLGIVAGSMFSGTLFAGEIPASVWSSTTPQINETHIFDGQVKTNSKGTFKKVVGFHSTAAPSKPVVGVVLQVQTGPNAVGVYTATVKISAGGMSGTKFSSMFPKRMSKEDVLKAIIYAYENKTWYAGTKWRGPTGSGFDIEGYLTSDMKKINTAYPIYVK